MEEIHVPVLINLVHMGDSITFGQYVDAQLRWSSLVYKKLDALYRTTPVQILALNRGISGETTRMGLERFGNDVQSVRPDVMTLQFGLNDCNCWLTDGGHPRVSPAAYEANLTEMIDRARRFGAAHIILANNHPTLRHKPQLNGETFEKANERYSEIARGVARRTEVTFCDIRKAFSAFTARELDDMLLPYPDHLHLSVKGNAHYADVIYPHIARTIEVVLKHKLAQKEGK
jgi:lysophospholipase L1-like esterase